MVSRSFLLSRLRQQAHTPAALALDSSACRSQEGQEVEGWQHGRAERRHEERKAQGDEEVIEEEENEVKDTEEKLEGEGCGKAVKRARGRCAGRTAAQVVVEESRRVCPLEKQGLKTYACAVHEEPDPAKEIEEEETDMEEDLLSLPSLADSAAAPTSQAACFSTSWKLPPEVTPQTEDPPSSNEDAPLRSPSSSPSSSSTSSSSSFRPLSLPWGVDRVLFLDTVEGLTGLFAFLRSSQEASCRALSADETAGCSLPPQEALRCTASDAKDPAEAPAEEAAVHASPSVSLSTERDGALAESQRRKAKSGEEEKKRAKKKNDAHVAGEVEIGELTSSRLAESCVSQSRTRAQISSDAVLSEADAASDTCGVSVSVLPVLPSLVPFRPFVVALDLEWTLPHAASVLSLATESRVFLVDLVNDNPVYKATLLQMLRWLFANPFIAKLMYQASGDITKLFFALGAVGSPGALVHCIDLRHPRVWNSPASSEGETRRTPEWANSLPSPAEARGPLVSPSSDPSLKPGAAPAGNTRERREATAKTKEGAPSCRGEDAGAEEKEADAAKSGAESFLVPIRKGRHLANAERELREGVIAKEHFLEKNEEETPERYMRPVKRRFPSLQEMCRQVLHADLDKSEQRSNWNMRPLTASQAHYAALDAYVLILLEAALRRQGWIPGNILGGLGEFSALSFRGRPSEFRIHYQKNASMQASKVEAAEKRHFKWRGS
ncbi:putative 3'-5' exonuclease [Toxoplasma gondii TgCatPRC2]|uniref:Putative 3'-5' exonuclease n=1 Tax=Toxoplasma gondii TgCatPRC2 TaxID=1130821 RepID=A0A151H0F3_TOXGO|nr:putative 3'-5' exonuclease [Toxoplasma gondii TgCatPRC2]